ncbi:protein unc-50 homolog A-like [Tubulanus polymorphus]|uniref:protein unc-50 homolog A-like n=1 Tax=Tubulanus polymorphus TaxID=672921 RepID=UPI003DA4733C
MYHYGRTSPPVSPSGSRPLSPDVLVTPGGANSAHHQSMSAARSTASAKRQKYFRRLFKIRQMDFEYAFWQMLYLFVSPQKVYRNFQYRKCTKDQFARDDPAFLVVLSFWLFVSSIGFAVVLRLSFAGFAKFLAWVIFVDCIGVGLLVATALWFVSNKYMIQSRGVGTTAVDDVEWGYAFDVHLNAFFPLLMILHFFQLPILAHVVNHDWFVGCLVGNTLWLVAVCYYIYITFLGYSALSFLKRTQIFLYPMTGMFLVYILSLVFNWNFSMGLCYFYHWRI